MLNMWWMLYFHFYSAHDNKGKTAHHGHTYIHPFSKFAEWMGLHRGHSCFESQTTNLLASFAASSAAVLNVSLPAAVGTALEAANNAAEITIADISDSSERAQNSASFSRRHFKAMHLASASKMRSAKQALASLSASKQHREDLRSPADSFAVVLKQEESLLAPEQQSVPHDVEALSVIMTTFISSTVACLKNIFKNCLIRWT